jgi:L-lactate dehydrogenase complex protein LldG
MSPAPEAPAGSGDRPVGEPGDARARILSRVRAAVGTRPREPRPGPFEGWRGESGGEEPDAVAGFVSMFQRAGGEVVRLEEGGTAADWLERWPDVAGGVAVGARVPPDVAVALPTAAPEDAAVGLSMASGAVAETGSLVLDARDGRRSQLLPPTHVVLVRESDVHATLASALAALATDLPSAIGLHSGPSKSADIGQILVKGVHGPGRVIALLLPETP